MKQAAEASRKAHEELENRVQERTAELARANETLQSQIAERERAEEELRLLSSAVEQSSEGIAVSDMEGNLLFVNDAFATMHGYTPEELVGKPLSIFHTPEQIPAVEAARRQVRETGEFSGEIWHVQRNGTVFPTLMHNSLLRDEASNPIGMIGTLRDITERKQTEERVQRLLDRQIAVSQIALVLGESRDLDKAYHTIYEHVRTLIDAEVFIISFYDNAKQLIRAGYIVTCETVQDVTDFPPIPLEEAEHSAQGQVICTGEPFYIPDFREAMTNTRTEYNIADNRTVSEGLPSPSSFGTMKPSASWLGVPMRIGKRVIGVISVQAGHPHAYGEEEQRLLSTIADQVAMAVEKARLYEEAQDHLESLTNLNHASQAVVSSLDAKEVLEQIVELAGSVVNSDFTSVVLVDETGKPVLGTEDFRGISPVVQRIRSNGTTRHVLDNGQPLLVDAISDEGAISPSLRLPDGQLMKANPALVKASIRSFAAVPIQVKEKILGILFVHSRQPRAFHGQLPLLTTFANQAAVALENARLYEAERKRATQFAVVNQVARKAVSILNPDLLLQEIVTAIQQGFEYHNVILLQLNETTGRLGKQAIAGGFENIGSPDYYQEIGKGLIGWTAQTGQPLLINDVSQDPRYIVGFPERVPTRAELCVPLKLGERVIGVLDVQEIQPNAFDEMDLTAMETLADQIAVAIENSRLFKAEREQRQLTEALKEAASAVSSTLDPDQVLERILEQVEQVVAGDHFNIMLIENDQARVVRQRGYESLSIKDQDTDFSRPITRYPSLVQMAQTREPIVVPDTATDPDWVYEEDQEWLRSYVATPIQTGDAIVGFLNVNGTRREQFDVNDARRLQAFAAHVATAIENARLHEKLREHAEQLEERVEERTAQLQAQYARLEAILRSTTDGIIVTDAKGEILQTNPVAQTWLTRTLSPEDAILLQKTVQDLARRAEAQPEIVLELTGLDLELKAAHIAEPGIAAAAVVAIHDVSHLKALNRMKSRFVSNVSHELRTPITVIKLYAHLMQKQPKRWKEYLDTLAQEADHQAQLIEDILQISRIDAGRLEMKPRLTSLNELTEIAITNHHGLVQERGLTLQHHPAKMTLMVLVDSQRMAQVLSHLVENAIHYTPEGGQVVVSTGKEKTEGRAWATATVMDTGMGISKEELPHIFVRFFRGEGPKQMQISGTGLGLAIAKDIVELHGGRVTVESQIGKGSTFTVWLPLAA
jgi:PAS domain S-box-containing protein